MSELSFYEMMSYQGDQIRELNDELTALRAWKEKAMPLLLALNSRLVQDMELFPENIPQLFEGQKATLTELLKEATK
jgi:hypothetical protein